MAKPKLVEVEWQDARGKYEQLSFKEAIEQVTLIHRFSVGYLVLKDRERVVICATYDPSETEHDVEGGDEFTAIPRGWVKKITDLNPSSTEEKEEP